MRYIKDMEKRNPVAVYGGNEMELLTENDVNTDLADALEKLLSALSLESPVMTPAIRNAYILANNALADWQEETIA
jgi:sugar/nucleoside kinase (ribokinase family)